MPLIYDKGEYVFVEKTDMIFEQQTQEALPTLEERIEAVEEALLELAGVRL